MITRLQFDRTAPYLLGSNLPETKEVEDTSYIDCLRSNSTDDSQDEIKKVIIEREPYIPSQKLVDAVNLAKVLGRPLLLQGEPGCGKTRLAYSVAFFLGLPLEKCYIKSTTRAQDLLYVYDAVKRLYDAQLAKSGDIRDIDPQKYIELGPLGRAIKRAQAGRRSVVLIDEIDKADLDFPNDLLQELDCFEFTINETGEHYKVPEKKPELRPIVIITHNEEKALPTAFLRRCIYYYLEFPEDTQTIQEILYAHGIGNEMLSTKAINTLQRLRLLGLDKKPGLSELIDWVGYLDVQRYPADSVNGLPFKEVLIKQRPDLQKVERDWKV